MGILKIEYRELGSKSRAILRADIAHGTVGSPSKIGRRKILSEKSVNR